MFTPPQQSALIFHLSCTFSVFVVKTMCCKCLQIMFIRFSIHLFATELLHFGYLNKAFEQRGNILSIMAELMTASVPCFTAKTY